MEELKLLVEMVAGLPSMALWVVAFFFAYKVIFIGSVYGVIRFVTEKLYEWGVSERRKEIRPMLDGICIDGTVNGVMDQLKRVAGRGTGFGSQYIHNVSVEWLEAAIDDKIEKDRQDKQAGRK